MRSRKIVFQLCPYCTRVLPSEEWAEFGDTDLGRLRLLFPPRLVSSLSRVAGDEPETVLLVCSEGKSICAQMTMLGDLCNFCSTFIYKYIDMHKNIYI